MKTIDILKISIHFTSTEITVYENEHFPKHLVKKLHCLKSCTSL